MFGHKQHLVQYDKPPYLSRYTVPLISNYIFCVGASERKGGSCKSINTLTAFKLVKRPPVCAKGLHYSICLSRPTTTAYASVGLLLLPMPRYRPGVDGWGVRPDADIAPTQRGPHCPCPNSDSIQDNLKVPSFKLTNLFLSLSLSPPTHSSE